MTTETRPPGELVSGSSNNVFALKKLTEYHASFNGVQAGLTQLLASLSGISANLFKDFEAEMNKPAPEGWEKNPTIFKQGGLLWQIANLTKDNTPGGEKEFSNYLTQITSEYQAKNSSVNAKNKVIDGGSSNLQNTVSSIAQSLQGLVQSMGIINSWTANLSRILQQ
jgi:hypothetical protein